MPIKSFTWVSILVCIGYFYIQTTECTSVEEDLTLSRKEKEALDKVKEAMLYRLPNDYMKTEVYLINWVRAASLDVDKAVQMLEDNLRWRKEEGMDEVISEDFSDLETDYPMDIDGIDYEGKPVLQVFVSEWDVRRWILTGQQQRGQRYCMRALEIMCKKVRDAQAKGELVTRFQVIFDFTGFNVQQHGCLRCIPQYAIFIIGFLRHYPNMADNIIFINSPPALGAILRLLKPMAVANDGSNSLGKSLKIFGTDKAEWKQFLLSIIPPDQLDRSLGGTKISV